MEHDNSILGLATIRRNRGISLEHISAATKISMRSLQAIECGEFKKLPGGIYNTSYIRQYAKAIEFDESQLLAYYHNRVGPTEVPSLDGARMSKGLFEHFRPASSIVR
jgi:cytoskeletal protein RodZ